MTSTSTRVAAGGRQASAAARVQADRLVLGLVLVGLGTVWFLHRSGVDLPWSVVPPAALLLTGLALLVLVTTGHGGQSTLVWWGAALLVVSVALGFGADRYVAPAGNVLVAPAVQDWPGETRRSAGNVDVDLTAHPLPGAGRLVVHLGTGNVTVVLPAAAPVHVAAEVGTGSILVDGSRVADGMDLSWSDQRPPTGVVVVVDVAVGQVEVRHV